MDGSIPRRDMDVSVFARSGRRGSGETAYAGSPEGEGFPPFKFYIPYSHNLQSNRAVVASHDLGHNEGVFHARDEFITYYKIVNSPSDIVAARV